MSKGFHSQHCSEERKGNKSVTNATAPWVQKSFQCPSKLPASFLASLLGIVFNLRSQSWGALGFFSAFKICVLLALRKLKLHKQLVDCLLTCPLLNVYDKVEFRHGSHCFPLCFSTLTMSEL